MESQRKRKLTQRNPLSDCTNTSHSSIPLKFPKLNTSSSSVVLKKPSFKKTSISNLDVVSNPSSFLTPLPKTSSFHGTIDPEASDPISTVSTRRTSSNKRKDREKEVVIPATSTPVIRKDKGKEDVIPASSTTIETEDQGKELDDIPSSSTANTFSSSVPLQSAKLNLSSSAFKEPISKYIFSSDVAVSVNLDDASNPRSSPPTFLSPPLPKTQSLHGTVDLEASDPISIVSRRTSSNKRKDKDKEVVIPASTPIKRKDKGKEVVISACSTTIVRKDQRTELGIPSSSTPNTFSSFIPLKSAKLNLSSSAFKKPTTKYTYTTNVANSVNLDDAPNPSSSAPTFLSPPLPKTPSLHVCSRRTSSNKRNDKGKEMVIKRKEVVIPSSSKTIERKYIGKEVDVPSSITSISRVYNTRNSVTNSSVAANLDGASNHSSQPSSLFSTPLPKSLFLRGTVDLEASEPISIVYSRRTSSNQRKEVVNPASSAPIKRKDKGKEVFIPESSTTIKRKSRGKEVDISSSSTPIMRVSNTREKSDGVEGANPPKAKALTVPCGKKHRSKSSKQDVFKDPIMQDYMEKQNAYFKMIDEFELLEEEVECISDDGKIDRLKPPKENISLDSRESGKDVI